MQNTQNKERDWSEVVKKLSCIAERAAKDKDRLGGSWAFLDLCYFRQQAHHILQESDKTHNPTTETHKLKSETLEFVVGGLYEDREGHIYAFIGVNPYFEEHKEHTQYLIFCSKNNGLPTMRTRDGIYGPSRQRDIIRKHVPAPKKHKIEFWLNLFINKGEVDWFVYFSKKNADMQALPDRIACLHIEREFYEGEGLDG